MTSKKAGRQKWTASYSFDDADPAMTDAVDVMVVCLGDWWKMSLLDHDPDKREAATQKLRQAAADIVSYRGRELRHVDNPGGRPTNKAIWESWRDQVNVLKLTKPMLTQRERYDDVAADWAVARPEQRPVKWTAVRDGISQLKKPRKARAKR